MSANIAKRQKSSSRMLDSEIRQLVFMSEPEFIPFALKWSVFESMMFRISAFKDYSLVGHVRQQCMIAEAFAARDRGDDMSYLYEFAQEGLKRAHKKRK